MGEKSERDVHAVAHAQLQGEDKLLSNRVDALKEIASAINQRVDGIDNRVGQVEKWQWLCYGIAIACGVLAVYVLRGLGLAP